METQLADAAGAQAAQAAPTACFVSYAREDVQHAVGLTRALTGRGHDCWCDVQDLIPGVKWQDDIEDALIRCDLFILLMTRLSLASPNCEREFELASELGKKIVPVQLDDVDGAGGLFYERIRAFQWIVPVEPADAGAIVARIVTAAGTDFDQARLIRDILLLARRSVQKAADAVLLNGASLRDAEQALVRAATLGPQRLREALAYLEVCRDTERFQARRRRLTVGAVMAVLAALTVAAVTQWRLAVSRERDNQASLLASEAVATLREPWLFTSWSSNARRAALLLVNALGMDVNWRYLEGGLELGQLVRPIRVRQPLPQYSTLAMSPDLELLAFGTSEGQIFVGRLDQSATRVADVGRGVWAVSFSASKMRLGVVDEDRRAYLVDLSLPTRTDRLPTEDAWKIAVSESRVAIGHDPSGLSIGDLRTGAWNRVSTPGRIEAVSIDPRTDVVATVTDTGVLLTVERDGTQKRERVVAASSLEHVVRLADGSIFAVAGEAGAFLLAGGAPKRLELPMQFGVTGLAVDDTQSLLAVAAWDGAIHVWDLADGRETARLPSAARDVDALFFDAGQRLHAIASGQHWEWEMPRRIPRLRVPCAAPVRRTRVADQHVWFHCGDGVRHVDTTADQWQVLSATIAGGTSWLVADGPTAMVGGRSGVFTLTADGGRIAVKDVSAAIPFGEHVDGRGPLAAGATADGMGIAVWDVRSASIVHREPAAGPVVALAVASGANILVYCNQTGRCVRRSLYATGPTQTRDTGLAVKTLVVAPTGLSVLIETTDDERWIWHPGRADLVQVKDEAVPAFASGFLLNGDRVFVSRDDVRVYEVGDGELIGTLQHRGEVQEGAVALDSGQLLLTVGFEKVGRLWDGRSLIELARFAAPEAYPYGAYEVSPGRFVLWGKQEELDIWDLTPAWLRETLCQSTLGELDDQLWRRVNLDPANVDRCGPSPRQP